MRFVPVKGAEQQAVLMLHRTRDLLIRQRTMLANAFRAHLSEFGIIAAQGIANLAKLATIAMDKGDQRIPPLARTCLVAIIGQFADLQARIGEIDRTIHRWHRSNEASRRLETVPGIGPITASAIAATVTDPTVFASGRHLAAWFGLVPRQNSSGGKVRFGHISKQGDPYIRRLLVVGAHAVLRYARAKKAMPNPWLVELLARRPYKVAAVAVANKMARVAWAILLRGETYRRPMTA